VKDGSLKSITIENENHQKVKEKREDIKEHETDPRWDELKKLLTDK
jgi:hypothetical protein